MKIQVCKAEAPLEGALPQEDVTHPVVGDLTLPPPPDPPPTPDVILLQLVGDALIVSLDPVEDEGGCDERWEIDDGEN